MKSTHRISAVGTSAVPRVYITKLLEGGTTTMPLPKFIDTTDPSNDITFRSLISASSQIGCRDYLPRVVAVRTAKLDAE